MAWYGAREEESGLVGYGVPYLGPKEQVHQYRLVDPWLKLQYRKILCFLQQEVKYDSKMGQGHQTELIREVAFNVNMDSGMRGVINPF